MRLKERKLNSDNLLKLTKNERIKLWNGHEPSGYLWIYTGSEAGWRPFRDRIILDTALDGFQVKLGVLCGPEYVEDLEDMSDWGLSLQL